MDHLESVISTIQLGISRLQKEVIHSIGSFFNFTLVFSYKFYIRDIECNLSRYYTVYFTVGCHMIDQMIYKFNNTILISLTRSYRVKDVLL